VSEEEKVDEDKYWWEDDKEGKRDMKLADAYPLS
jgi:hypothetical protein